MRYKFLLIFTPLLYCLAGCDLINPDESTPTYVKIDSVQLKINEPNKEGSAAHNITNVWMYYNNTLIGVYDVPCNVPVITEGDKGELSIIPGITLNGLVSLQPPYPFFRVDTSTLVSNPGGTQQVTPVTSYLPQTKFPFKEDFEVNTSFEPFALAAASETAIGRTNDPQFVFEGGGSGLVRLSADIPVSESIAKNGVPITQGESYVEINYKCSVPFEVGLYNTLEDGIEAYQYIFGVKSTDTWKKIYIELASYTGANKGTDYRLLIKAILPEGQSDGYVAVDNIKIVSF